MRQSIRMVYFFLKKYDRTGIHGVPIKEIGFHRWGSPEIFKLQIPNLYHLYIIYIINFKK